MASIKQYKTTKGKAWRVQYRSPDGKSRTKQGFRTKDEAQAWADKNATRIREGEWINPNAGRITVEELWPSWIRSQHHLATSSTRALTSSWRTHVQPRWGSWQVSTITAATVQDWVNDLHAQGKSAAVIQRAFNLLSNLLDVAVRDEKLRRNPCRGVRVPSRPTAKTKVLTPAQVALLIENMPRYRSLVTFLAYTGVRWGEAVALTVGDIDLVAGRATISKAAPTVGGRAVLGETKTRRVRVVALPGVVVEALRPELQGKLPSALVWMNEVGGFVTTPSRRSWWHSAVDACRVVDPDFPCVSPHDLRHAAASLLISAGASVLVVQRQLGHSSPRMTLDRYSHLFEDDLDAVVAAVSDVVELSCGFGKSAG